MRELKFRVYDKNLGMSEPLFITDLGIMAMEGAVNLENIMQYTGSVDRNGKEIYEGDIVDFRRGERKLYVAFFHGCWFMCGDLMSKEIDYRNLDHYTKHDGPVVVIGNIYETPELLEKRIV